MATPARGGPAAIEAEYEFECPQYRDFDMPDDEGLDAWFDGKDGVEIADELNNSTSDLNTSTASSALNTSSTLTMPISGLQLSADFVAAELSAVVGEVLQAAEELTGQIENAQHNVTVEMISMEAEPICEEEAVAVVEAAEIVQESVEAVVEAAIEPEVEAEAEFTPMDTTSTERAQYELFDENESAPASAYPSAPASTDASMNVSSHDALLSAVSEHEISFSTTAVYIQSIATIAESAFAPEAEFTDASEIQLALVEEAESAPVSGFASASASGNTSLNLSGHEEMLAATADDITFSAEDDMMNARSSMVFNSAMKRSSMGMFQTTTEVQAEPAAIETVVANISEAAVVANNTSAEVEAASAVTDVEVEALQLSLVTPPVSVAHVDAQFDFEEDVEQPKSILEQFESAVESDVLDISAVEEPLPPMTITAPIMTASRKSSFIARKSTAPGSVPNFLRPTAAALAKQVAAAVQQVADAATSRRPSAILSSRLSTNVMLGAQTPKTAKKRQASSSLDELARPKTVVKKAQDETPAAPTTGRKLPLGVPRLTIAQSPALSTRARASIHTHAVLLSTEEQEVQKIEAERVANAKQMKAVTKAWSQQAENPAADVIAMPIRVGQLTQPVEFNLHSSKRARTTFGGLSNVDINVQRESLAGAKKETASGEPILTKVQPFSFLTSSRGRASTAKAPLSHSATEEALMASMPQFKALPLNRDIFTSGGEMGVPRVHKAKLTDPTSPNLATKERGNKRKQEDDSNAQANAVSMGFSSFAAPQGSPSSKQQSAKKPRSSIAPPQLAAGLSYPFQLQTEVRGRIAEEALARKLHEQAEAEQAARDFVARPLFLSTPAPAPAPTPRQLPQPISPKCNEASRQAKAKIAADLAAEAQRAQERTLFKARPNPFAGAGGMGNTEAFEVKRSERPLTAPVQPILASEERALKHAEREAEKAAAAAAHEAMLATALAEAKEIEARELAEHRRTLVPRALPAPNKDAPVFAPKPSAARLTQPESPMLVTKRRAVSHRAVAIEIEPLPITLEETEMETETVAAEPTPMEA